MGTSNAGPPPTLFPLSGGHNIHCSSHMAAVSISPLPSSQSAMSGRRVPLGNNPNGANSPFRPLGANTTKQKRSYATIQREESYGHAPPAKKQMLSTQQALRTPPRPASQYQPEAKLLARKANATQPSTYERGVRTAVRERSAQQTVSRAAKTSEQNLESVLAWQKHYRQVFPNYVFYFEGVTEEIRHKFAKQVTSLGAVSLHIWKYPSCSSNLITASRKVLFQLGHTCCHNSNHSTRGQIRPQRKLCNSLSYKRCSIRKQPASNNQSVPARSIVGINLWAVRLIWSEGKILVRGPIEQKATASWGCGK